MAGYSNLPRTDSAQLSTLRPARRERTQAGAKPEAGGRKVSEEPLGTTLLQPAGSDQGTSFIIDHSSPHSPGSPFLEPPAPRPTNLSLSSSSSTQPRYLYRPYRKEYSYRPYTLSSKPPHPTQAQDSLSTRRRISTTIRPPLPLHLCGSRHLCVSLLEPKLPSAPPTVWKKNPSLPEIPE